MSACSFVGVLVYWPGGGVVWWCSGVVVCVVVSWCIVVYTSNCRSRIVQTQDCTSRSMIISSVGRGTSSAPQEVVLASQLHLGIWLLRLMAAEQYKVAVAVVEVVVVVVVVEVVVVV